jgi:hypothetical protein
MGGGSTTYDYGFRIYNSTLAKFLSQDPLYMEFAWYSPYHFAGNKPIWAIDLDGAEETYYTNYLIGMYEDHANGMISDEELIRKQEIHGASSKFLLPLSALSLGITAFGVRAVAIYLLEETAEEMAGHPIIPDPGDAIQSLVRRSVQPDPPKLYRITPDMTSIQKREVRKELASDFYLSKGYDASQAGDHTKHINFDLGVQTKTIRKDANQKLVQYRLKGSSSQGSYYAPIGTKPEEIGLRSEDVDMENSYVVTLKEDVKVLQSHHVENAEVYYRPGSGQTTMGGGTQYFAPDINQNNAIFEKLQSQ